MLNRLIQYVSLLTAVVFVFVSVPLRARAVSTSAEGMVLINADTLEVLDSENADKRLPMASTTKLMTALLVAENCDIECEIVTTKEMVTVEGSSMGLLEGDKVSFYALLVGMMLPSGNDAANTAAIAVAGSVSNFAEMMNRRAKEIGMHNTNFVTPSGLDDKEHFSTAYDMALLAAEVLKNSVLRRIVASEKLTVSYGNPPYKRTLYNHNKLLSRYEFAIGLKTGYTKKSGRCLVSAAQKDGSTVIAVTLNAPDDWSDHERLLEQGLTLLKSTDMTYDVSKVKIPLVGADECDVEVETPDFLCGMTDDPKYEITHKIEHEPFLYAPISHGQTVGSVDYYCNGKLIRSMPLTAKGDISAKKPKPQSEFNKWLCIIFDLICKCI